jgi:hypothetical protein
MINVTTTFILKINFMSIIPPSLVCTVSGTIYDSFNAPLANVTVRAFDKDLRSEQQLGETLTDAQGFYKINYNSQQFAVAEENAADLLIKVYHLNSNTLCQLS